MTPWWVDFIAFTSAGLFLIFGIKDRQDGYSPLERVYTHLDDLSGKED